MLRIARLYLRGQHVKQRLFSSAGAIDDSGSKKSSLLRAWGNRKKGEVLLENTIDKHDVQLQHVPHRGTDLPPQLADGLRKLFHKPGVTTFDESGDPYPEAFRRIHDVEDVDHSQFGDFMTSSRDEVLHSISRELGADFVGSTSSVTALLSQFHFQLMGTSLPEESQKRFSTVFGKEQQNFARVLLKASGNIIRKREGNVWGIDSMPQSNTAQNKILMQLGHQLENFFTMEPPEFKEQLLLETQQKGIQRTLAPGVYSYARFKNFLVRSQLDCHEPSLKGEKKVVDLKTRATLPIRLDPAEYKTYLDYHLINLKGEYHSYEREQLDICRTILIKYNFQARLGNMNGVVVAYHNTDQVFGFEHMSTDQMDEILFVKERRAEIGFSLYKSLMADMMTKLTELYADHDSFKVVAWHNNQNLPYIDIFVLTPPAEGFVAELDTDDPPLPTEKLPIKEVWYNHQRAFFHVDAMSDADIIKELEVRGAGDFSKASRVKLCSTLEGLLTPAQTTPSAPLYTLSRFVRDGRLQQYRLFTYLKFTELATGKEIVDHGAKALLKWDPTKHSDPELGYSFEKPKLTADSVAFEYRRALESYRCNWAKRTLEKRNLDLPITPEEVPAHKAKQKKFQAKRKQSDIKKRDAHIRATAELINL